jgi:hypothetical protein
MESLTRLFPYVVKSLNTIIQGQTSTTGGTTLVNNPFAPTHGLLTTGFVSGNKIRRPFEFVEGLIKYLSGDTMPSSDQAEVIKQWFKPWVDRVKFKDRFVPSVLVESLVGVDADAEPHIFPILKATQSTSAIEALAKMGNQLDQGSFYNIVTTIFQAMYYELLMLPTAPYLLVDETTREPFGEDTVAGGPPRLRNVVASYMTKPQTIFGIPPRFNVLWPSMIEQFSYDESYARQPTRTYLGNPHVLNMLAQQSPNDVLTRALTVGYPAEANERLSRKKTGDHSEESVFNFITKEERFKGPVYNNMNTPTWYMFLQQTERTSAANAALQYKFCRYEHLRTRAAQRNAGTSGPYNPYIVPGCPSAIIDNEHSSVHLIAYVTQINHSFSQENMSTQVSMTYATPISEVIDLLMDQMVKEGIDEITDNTPSIAPEHPVQAIRDVFQTKAKASEYYQRMFYGADKPKDKVLFDLLKVFGLRGDEGIIEPIQLNKENAERVVSSPVTGEAPDFRLTPGYRRFMDDPEAAFTYAARPICTLEQFIDAQGDRGTRRGLVSASSPSEGHGAPYYVQILVSNEDIAQQESVDVDGNPCRISESDSSRSWQERLLAYRARVYQTQTAYRG